MSTIKKKAVVQSKALLNDILSVCFDCCTPGTIITLLGLYELMLLEQVQIETGIKEILLSLLPSFLLSALGWYLKRGVSEEG